VVEPAEQSGRAQSTATSVSHGAAFRGHHDEHATVRLDECRLSGANPRNVFGELEEARNEEQRGAQRNERASVSDDPVHPRGSMGIGSSTLRHREAIVLLGLLRTPRGIAPQRNDPPQSTTRQLPTQDLEAAVRRRGTV